MLRQFIFDFSGRGNSGDQIIQQSEKNFSNLKILVAVNVVEVRPSVINWHHNAKVKSLENSIARQLKHQSHNGSRALITKRVFPNNRLSFHSNTQLCQQDSVAIKCYQLKKQKNIFQVWLWTFRWVNILITDNDDELFNKVSLQH